MSPLRCGVGRDRPAPACRPPSSLVFANGSSVRRLVQGAARENTPTAGFFVLQEHVGDLHRLRVQHNPVL
jgi:hypothetical protein